MIIMRGLWVEAVVLILSEGDRVAHNGGQWKDWLFIFDWTEWKFDLKFLK